MKSVPPCLFAVLLPWMAACKRDAEAPVAVAAPVKEVSVIRGRTAKAEMRVFPRFLRVTGQLAAKSDSIVAADTAGKVVAVEVERGSVVAKGDVLARLDERQPKLLLAEAAAAVQLATSRLTLAQHEQARNQPLAEKKAIADSVYQQLLTEVVAREADVAASTARRDQAQKMLDDCTIRTPFAGVVAEKAVDPGEFVGPGVPVARVVESGTLRLVLNVPETEVASLAEGQKVEFTTAAFAERHFEGTLKYMGAAMREISRDLVVEALVDNAEGTLRPGFFCDARILLSEEKALGVPEKALRLDGSRRKVFVVESGGMLGERLVDVGESRGGFTEVRRGVQPGEVLLLEPGPEAADGLKFEPAP
ncbi:MAG: efflux RND transporter periplasmic adaptor subunit [Prosthecobacter sp.]